MLCCGVFFSVSKLKLCNIYHSSGLKLENVVEKWILNQDYCWNKVEIDGNLVKITEKMKNRWRVLSIYCVVFTIYDIFGRWNATSSVYRVETRGATFIFIYLIRVIIIYFGSRACISFFLYVTSTKNRKKNFLLSLPHLLSIVEIFHLWPFLWLKFL